MMTRLPLLTLLLVFSQWAGAQDSGLRGKITDNQNTPLAFASLYVNETGAGAVTNEEGDYELRLAPGDYTIVIQFLGYQTRIEEVTIGESFRERNYQLQPQSFELKEVEVTSDGEDPAYTVMRRAIAKAEYHRQQLDRYQANVYIKGSGRLLKSPGIIRKFVEREGIDSTLAFTSETVSEVTYERPNTYKERVISIYTTGEDNSPGPMGFINGSFYEPEISGAVSPLSPKAFGYYQFRLDGNFQDRGYLVNKIKVTPRSRGDNVFEGYIYILEDYWSIHSLELTTYQYGFQFDINALFNPVEQNVWMPVRYTFYVTGRIFGFAFEYEYLTTVNQYDITLNPELPTELEVVDDKLNKELANQMEKARKKDPEQAEAIEKLSQGEELTRKELRKMMREYEKEERKEQAEPDVVINTAMEIDSNAYKPDSAFWAEVRPIPLTEYEVKGYEWQDSIAQAEEVEADTEGAGNTRRSGDFEFFDLLFGGSYKVGKRTYVGYDSPLMDIQFNPVEGWNGTGSLTYQRRRDHYDLDIGTDLRYGFAWRRFNMRLYTEHEFGQNKQHELALEGGRFVQQYNWENPVPELFNTVYTLFNENYVHMFEKEYAQLRYRRDWASDATLRLGAEWAHRRNIADYFARKWIPEDDAATPNWPENEEVTYPLAAREKAFVVTAGVEVRPWQKYRIRNGNRRPLEDSSPTLGLSYRGGLSGVAESVTNYDLLEFTYRHKIPVGVRGILDLRVNAGAFLNDEYIGFADFKHFPGNELIFTASDPVASFRMLPFYQNSTQQEFVAAHAHYQFRKFLFTQIWEVQMLGIRENVFTNYLYTPTSEQYFEVGYGIDNIFRVLRLELVTSFRDGRYENFGVRIGVASNIGGGFVEIN